MKASESTKARRNTLRHDEASMVSQSLISNPMYGNKMSVTTVPIRPELMLAMATGEIAYRKLAATRNQL
jgi:hypothetical protein